MTHPGPGPTRPTSTRWPPLGALPAHRCAPLFLFPRAKRPCCSSIERTRAVLLCVRACISACTPPAPSLRRRVAARRPADGSLCVRTALWVPYRRRRPNPTTRFYLSACLPAASLRLRSLGAGFGVRNRFCLLCHSLY